MGKIRQMSEKLANQIAAGEVVERPASVVKELVENAIDANSQEIIVELVEAGIQEIKVTDNGEGMDEEDISLAFLSHATSKVFDTKDLFQIHSLGFRGEALASIAAVSKLRLESNISHDSHGHFIEIEGGQIVDKGISSARPGTSIQVSSLFYNTPARLKHLKTIQTELSHSLKYLQNIAMAYPNIRFRLIHNGQVIFSSIGNNDLRQAIAHVYQPSLARELIAIQGNSTDFNIYGYISKPTLTRTSKRYIHWFINGRPIQSYLLDDVFVKAYERQLMIGRYPVGVIHIELDPRLVDVNVHPSKRNVRLSKEDELYQLITEIVQGNLASINPIPDIEDDLLKASKKQVNEFSDYQVREKIQENYHQSSLNENQHDLVTHQGYSSIIDQSNPQDTIIYPERSVDKDNSISIFSDDDSKPFDQLRYVGQIHGTYLIAEGSDSFYLIDQHAAQERIRYEAFMEEEYPIKDQQQLLIPIVLNFSPAQSVEIESLLGTYENLGIYLESFGSHSYKLDSYPVWIDQDELESLIIDLADLLLNNKDLTVQEIKEASIIMRSCRGAIKANHYLNDEQAIALIHQLSDLKDPYHCPHGRPVFVEFSSKTLEKLFKRIQDSHQGGQVR